LALYCYLHAHIFKFVFSFNTATCVMYIQL
jgi:hypothetical protein